MREAATPIDLWGRRPRAVRVGRAAASWLDMVVKSRLVIEKCRVQKRKICGPGFDVYFDVPSVLPCCCYRNLKSG